MASYDETAAACGDIAALVQSRYDSLMQQGMCACGVDHETGRVLIIPPEGRGFSRNRDEPPTKYELYIAGMQGYIVDSYIHRLIEHACPGQIFTLRYMRSKQGPHGPYTYAFVDAPNMEAAVKLYEALDGHRISKGRFLSVRNATQKQGG